MAMAQVFIPSHQDPLPPLLPHSPSPSSFLPPHTSTATFFPPHTSTATFLPPHTSTSTATFLPPHTSTSTFLPPHTSTATFFPPHTSTATFVPPHTSTSTATFVPPHTSTSTATFVPPHTSTSFLPSSPPPHAHWEEDTVSSPPPHARWEDGTISVPPPAPPPSPELLPTHIHRVFEIDPKMFESSSRRYSALPPSPTNSFEFSSVFTPNKSPLISEPDSPTCMSPGEFPDSIYSPSNLDFSPSVDLGLHIPATCFPLETGQDHTHTRLLSYSHSEGDSFLRALHAQLPHLTASQLPQLTTSCDSTSLLGGRDDNALHLAPRPRSHTHPSHSLTPHTTYTSEQLRERRREVHRLHPHLPLTFETASLLPTIDNDYIADSGFHEVTLEPISPRKKSTLKRKSEELGYEVPPLLYSCGTYNLPSDTDSSWLVIENASTTYPQGKKACQEGVLRRQSASFSGGFTLPGSSLTDSSTFSAPSTPTLGVTDPSSLHFLSSFPSQVRRHTFDFNSSAAGVPPSSLPALQSMETEGGSPKFGAEMDNIDAMDCDLPGHSEVDTLSRTLCQSHLGQLVTLPDHPTPFPHFPAVSPPTLSPPPVATTRSHSSGEGCADYSFSRQIPGRLVQGSDCSFPGPRGPGRLDSMAAAESKFALSKSL